MKMRYEYKFKLPVEILDEIRALMRNYVNVDPYADRLPDKEYTVRSIYLDSRDMKFYHEKIAGIRMRKKLRIRAYNKPVDDSLVFLEIKRKDGAFISKDRAPLEYQHLNPLLKTRQVESFVKTANGTPKEFDAANKFFYYLGRQGLYPKILIIYEREPFISKFDHSFRITFDKQLRSVITNTFDEFIDEKDLVPTMPGFFILEAKFFAGLPEWFRKILSQYGLQRMALSKYCMCLDSHKTQHRIISLNHTVGKR